MGSDSEERGEGLRLQLPVALAVLRDPHMQSSKLYSRSALSQFMLLFSGGYFLCVPRREAPLRRAKPHTPRALLQLLLFHVCFCGLQALH